MDGLCNPITITRDRAMSPLGPGLRRDDEQEIDCAGATNHVAVHAIPRFMHRATMCELH
jgi:hypothetical protein